MQASPHIVDINEQNLMDVLARSEQVPVILDFWADWCQPCRTLGPLLEKIVAEEQGKVLLARVNADEQQAIAAQFQVRSLPTLKLVFRGKLVDELVGAHPEAHLRQWLAPVLGGGDEDGEESFLEQVRMAIQAGHGDRAEQALRQALDHEPDRHNLRAALADYLLAAGRLDDARSLVAEVAEDVPPLRPFRARFALLDELEGQESLPLDVLAARIRESGAPEDLYAFGLQAAAAGHFREGLESLLRLLRDHREFRDGIARQALLKVFDCLPKGDPLASEYRRKMFNCLH